MKETIMTTFKNIPGTELLARTAKIFDAFTPIVDAQSDDEDNVKSTNTMRAINGVALMIVTTNQAFSQPQAAIVEGSARSFYTILKDLTASRPDDDPDGDRHAIYALALSIFEGKN